MLALRSTLALALTAGLSAAQGADDCSNATPIVGVGVFSFDNSGAGTDGSSSGCDMRRDVWFAWTATATDSFSVSTCGRTGVDSMLGVYDGTACPTGAPITCNDDACGLQSTVSFQATSGAQYLLRVGVFPGSPGGSGAIEVTRGGSSSDCQNLASGPDVIVGDVSGVEVWGSRNGMSGYSLGTTSCNLGDAELLWEANNTNHPVIGQNIYRLEDGRFEQIGQSWLKHGFTALQGTVCCNSCQPSGTGSRLGVGCSDPYGASLNGFQSGLGPRSEVNAFTGQFVYPFTGINQTGDRPYKRCQVVKDDVRPSLHPTAKYFGEAQYVAADDAAAGNGFNNVSWRPLARPGHQMLGAFVLNATSFTRREEPALMAWKEEVPSVDVQTARVPGEGQFVVASDAIDEGNGWWRYEYAIFNQNSHFSGQSFSVPVGSAVNVTDVGMSFPHAHSGEPYSNVSWIGNYDGSVVRWNSETFAQNPDGNALRWGTTYSFWFRASAAPESKVAELGLFRPGSGRPVQVQAFGPADGDDPVVTNFCRATPNSTGVPGKITARDFDLAARTMELHAWDLPTDSFGYFLASLTTDFVPGHMGGQGTFCLGGTVGRDVGGVVPNTGAAGELTVGVSLDRIPQGNGFVAVQPGETWHFQCWHRDAATGTVTSNMTDGVRVLFP